jgi:hypothetical protein
LAFQVKKAKTEAGFFVYNGAKRELSPDIDGYLPSSAGDVSMEKVIVPFLKEQVRKWSYRLTQPRLF